MNMDKYISTDIQNKYNFYNYRHAVEIITQAFPDEWNDILHVLSAFRIEETALTTSGGSETNIPGKFESILYPRKWRNVQITSDLNVKFFERIIDQKKYSEYPAKESVIPNYISGHQVDYLKGRVAISIEWNKKDLAFDKTLTSLRAFYDCNLISAGVIITRDADLNEVFKEICDNDGRPIFRKYGSTSTWTGKLLPRLDAQQAGGCPILAIGIKRECIEGYGEY